MGRIAVTTLVLHAKDDPIVSHDDGYDWDRMAANQHVISVRTVRGGHLVKGWTPTASYRRRARARATDQ